MGAVDSTGLLQATLRPEWDHPAGDLVHEDARFPGTIVCTVDGGRWGSHGQWWRSWWQDGHLNGRTARRAILLILLGMVESSEDH